MKKLSLKNCILPIAALVMAGGIVLGKSMSSFIPVLFALLFAIAGVILLKKNWRIVAIFSCVFCVGIIGGICAFNPSLPKEGTYRVTGIVTDAIRDGEGTQHKTMLQSVTLDGKHLSGSTYWSFYSPSVPEELTPGVKVSFDAKLYHPDSSDNPGGFDFREYLLTQGATVGIYGFENPEYKGTPLHLSGTSAHLRYLLSEKLNSVLGNEVGSYASAMILGERQGLPDEDKTAFNRLGIAHILSVSGFHVGVLAAIISFFLKKLRVSRVPSLICKALVLSAYCLLTGLHAPVVRASLLLILYEYGRIRNRQIVSINLLALSAIAIMLFAPAQIFSAGFQLTYSAMIGMIALRPTFCRGIQCKHKLTKKLADGFFAALAAQIGILLPELYWYRELPLLGIFINTIIMALSSVAICVFWLILLLSPIPGIGTLAGKAVAAAVTVFLKLIRLCGSSPSITLRTPQANLLTAVGWIALIVALCCFIRPKAFHRAIGVAVSLAIIAFSLIPPSNSSTYYIQLSVGNADCAVICDEDSVVVIDTGEDGEALSQYLSKRKMDIDALFITHLHQDHAGGLETLLDDGIKIHEIIIPYGSLDADISPQIRSLVKRAAVKGTKLTVYSRSDEMEIPSGKIACVWPENGKVRPNQDANMFSMVLLCQIKGTTLLLTGDIDGWYENYAALPVDILKVPHHGSKASTSEEFLQSVSPQILVLSCGDDARPQSIAERSNDIPLYSTRSMGAVTITFTNGSFTVETEH